MTRGLLKRACTPLSRLQLAWHSNVKEVADRNDDYSGRGRHHCLRWRERRVCCGRTSGKPRPKSQGVAHRSWGKQHQQPMVSPPLRVFSAPIDFQQGLPSGYLPEEYEA